MKYRKLGRTGLEISEIGYGAWGIGGKQWKGGTDDESCWRLRRSFELGLNFIDTALAYGDGHSETLVSEVVKDAPHPVYLATKVPPKNRMWPAAPGIEHRGCVPVRLHRRRVRRRVSATWASTRSICNSFMCGIRAGCIATNGSARLKI